MLTINSPILDKFWDDGGAVTPDVAAKSLIEWIDDFDISHTGEYVRPMNEVVIQDLRLRHFAV